MLNSTAKRPWKIVAPQCAPADATATLSFGVPARGAACLSIDTQLCLRTFGGLEGGGRPVSRRGPQEGGGLLDPQHPYLKMILVEVLSCGTHFGYLSWSNCTLCEWHWMDTCTYFQPNSLVQSVVEVWRKLESDGQIEES